MRAISDGILAKAGLKTLLRLVQVTTWFFLRDDHSRVGARSYGVL